RRGSSSCCLSAATLAQAPSGSRAQQGRARRARRRLPAPLPRPRWDARLPAAAGLSRGAAQGRRRWEGALHAARRAKDACRGPASLRGAPRRLRGALRGEPWRRGLREHHRGVHAGAAGRLCLLRRAARGRAARGRGGAGACGGAGRQPAEASVAPGPQALCRRRAPGDERGRAARALRGARTCGARVAPEAPRRQAAQATPGLRLRRLLRARRRGFAAGRPVLQVPGGGGLSPRGEARPKQPRDPERPALEPGAPTAARRRRGLAVPQPALAAVPRVEPQGWPREHPAPGADGGPPRPGVPRGARRAARPPPAAAREASAPRRHGGAVRRGARRPGGAGARPPGGHAGPLRGLRRVRGGARRARTFAPRRRAPAASSRAARRHAQERAPAPERPSVRASSSSAAIFVRICSFSTTSSSFSCTGCG
ncbi:unnamed protein product, partial [Prorocentrum cordatum]